MLIGEIARISGLSKDGIRHYEAMGLITSKPREAGSRIYRDYDAAALVTITQVRDAQRLGLSLAEIAPLLRAYGNRSLSAKETAKFLADRLQVIRSKIEALREIETYIEQKLQCYQPARPGKR